MAVTSVVLDLDGTLWDSLPWYAELMAGQESEAARLVEQMRAGASAAKLLKAAGITPAGFRTSTASNACSLYPDAEATLGELSERGVPLGVVTNLPAWIAEPMIAASGIDHFVGATAIATYATTKRHKPHPDPLLHVLEELDVAADERAWYVGDSDSDLACAHAAGVSFAWASWGYARVPVDGADRVLNGWKDLLSL